MAPQTLKAVLRLSGGRLNLSYEDAAGRRLEIRTIVSNPTIRIDGGAPILLSSPRLRANETTVEYELPEQVSPDPTLTLRAPVGWALTIHGAVPALADLKVENPVVPALADLKVENPVAAPARPELQKPITPEFVSARVLASGRVLEVIFGSETPPSELGTFVDHHLTNADAITLTGSATRSSLKFAGCSASRGQDEVYRWSPAHPSYAGTLKGETLTVYQGANPIGTVGPYPASTNEVQQVTLSGATGGTFTLTFEGKTTAPIAFDATATVVDAALEALTNIGSGGVAATGDPGGPWTVTFSGSKVSKSNRQPMTVDTTALTGASPTAAVATLTEGFGERDQILADFTAIFDNLPVPADAQADKWVLYNSKTYDVKDAPLQSYRLTVSDGTTSYTTAPIEYGDQNRASSGNQVPVVQALRAVLGPDSVVAGIPLNDKTIVAIVFRREFCPIWPITVTVEDSSVPLFAECRRETNLNYFVGSNQQFTLYFRNIQGCQDHDFSVVSDNPTSPLNQGLERLVRGDSRYRWSAYWYIHDPAEVIQYGETLTVSGPAGLLKGATTLGPSGDQTAAFTDQAVENLSWAGPTGDLSGDLCHVTDAANGIDDGWGRFRTEAPPASWIMTDPFSMVPADQPPMRIAYIDPVNGTNAATNTTSPGIARLNDPTRPYRSPREANNDAKGSKAATTLNLLARNTPTVFLFKKGTVFTDSDPKNGINSINNGCGVSHDAPLIISTYWMASDGPEPSPYATYRGTFLFNPSGSTSLNNYSNVIWHGLVIEGQITTGITVADYATWDCVFPPHLNSRLYTNPISITPLAVRLSLVRTLIYDHWALSGNVSGIHGTDFADLMFDQTTFMRNGYRGFSSYNGERINDKDTDPDKSYMALLGADPLADLPTPYMNSFDHNVYLGNGMSNPVKCFNTYSTQGVFASMDLRIGTVMYGCCHYRDAFGVQTIGDGCHARLASSHVRGNVNLRMRTTQGSRGWGMIWSTWASHEIVGSLNSIVEDNLYLEPTIGPGTAYQVAVSTYDLSSMSPIWGMVLRQNTMIDQGYAVSASDQNSGGGSVPMSPLKMLVSRNLIVRTMPKNTPNMRIYQARLQNMAAWSGLTIDQNYYIAVDDRPEDFDPNSGSNDFSGWQSAGLDLRGVRVIGTLETATARPVGGPDCLVDFLAAQPGSGVTDDLSALSLFRDRRPGTWDDDLYTPLGRSGGVIAAASQAYRPMEMVQDLPTPSGYFGALNYTAAGTNPVSQERSRRPPRITPQQLQRVGR